MSGLDLKNWNEEELEMLDSVLGSLPEADMAGNEHISELVREDILTRSGKKYAGVSGLYRPSEGSLIIFDAAFGKPLRWGERSYSFFDLTLRLLVGQSLFCRDEARVFWAEHFYPLFDQGRGTFPRIKLIDRDSFSRKVSIHTDGVAIHPEETSLDECFAICYALNSLDPAILVTSYHAAHDFFG